MAVDIVFNELMNFGREFEKTMARITLRTALFAEKVAKESMEGPKSGRLYKVSKTGELHQASAPGEAPAVETSNLVNHIYSEQVNGIDARTVTNIEYALPLEFGTAKMAARPFMTPASHQAEEMMPEIATQEYQKLIRRFLL